MRRPTVVQGIAALAMVATLTGACSDEPASTCTELREPLDPLSIQHVIDAKSATFLTDPPTSGPHIAGPAANGLLDVSINAAAQVRVLEAGGVVVQYRSPVTAEQLRSLLADAEIPLVVAPGLDLSNPVVATAWTWKLTCDTADLGALNAFIASRPSDAPGED